MTTPPATPITVSATVAAPISTVWSSWTDPAHITKWCQASEDWHAPYADNDVRTGGTFKTTMAAKDGSFSFDFAGRYTNVIPNQLLEYVMEDGRKVSIAFQSAGDHVAIAETFDPETENPAEMQRSGWQAILDNFKRYTEAL